MEAEGCPAGSELSVVVGDDRWIRRLNRQYKGRDAATDVLAFPQDVGPKRRSHRWRVLAVSAPVLLGDVAISAETAARQASGLGHATAQEVAILLTHGILHLTGWRDDSAAGRRRMMQRTEQVLREIKERGER
jgi:probable rRNA maturation factor